MSRWPNLFIVGAPKAGTHSLYELLKQHPSVYMSPRKEPYFFCRDIIADDDEFCNPIRDEKEYLKLFEDSKDEEILGEATVSYLADPNAAKRIKEIMSSAEKNALGVRVSVKSGGCAGMSYVMEYAKSQNPNDELIEEKGVKVFIDPGAVMYLLGTTMDFKEEEFSSSFVFNNPNETERCGCGESFKV